MLNKEAGGGIDNTEGKKNGCREEDIKGEEEFKGDRTIQKVEYKGSAGKRRSLSALFVPLRGNIRPDTSGWLPSGHTHKHIYNHARTHSQTYKHFCGPWTHGCPAARPVT